MKNLSKKIIGASAVLGLAGAVYSFKTGEGLGDEATKKYEVVRMVNGEMTSFDTTIAASSNYTPTDYLADLGFENDQQINIIDFTLEGGENQFYFENGDEENGDKKVIMIEMDEDIEEIDMGDVPLESHEIRVEKKIIKSEDGNEEADVEVMIGDALNGFNIDSLIALAMAGHEGDSGQVIMKKMIISDEERSGEDGTFEWHDVNSDGADYHKEVTGPNHHLEIAVWGDSEDYTLVIVTDSEMDPSNTTISTSGKNAKTPQMTVYPNPSKESTQLQLNFEDKKATQITISDMKGSTIMQLELGSFKGQFDKTLDVSKWQKGVYLIQVNHGSEKLIEKLIVK